MALGTLRVSSMFSIPWVRTPSLQSSPVIQVLLWGSRSKGMVRSTGAPGAEPLGVLAQTSTVVLVFFLKLERNHKDSAFLIQVVIGQIMSQKYRLIFVIKLIRCQIMLPVWRIENLMKLGRLGGLSQLSVYSWFSAQVMISAWWDREPRIRLCPEHGTCIRFSLSLFHCPSPPLKRKKRQPHEVICSLSVSSSTPWQTLSLQMLWCNLKLSCSLMTENGHFQWFIL